MILANLRVHRTSVNCSRSRFFDSVRARILCPSELFWIMLEHFQALCTAEIKDFSFSLLLIRRVFGYVHTAHRIGKLLTRVRLLYMMTVGVRSEEHTSELQSLMHITYAVFFLKKKK